MAVYGPSVGTIFRILDRKRLAPAVHCCPQTISGRP